ncbi:MBL fold metallo-hydrolase [Rhodoferax sp. U11-2br]|uniref:MBL fold metallo-hydrolase n=1 Tax=Rhodoferax sp. U11-2br TaxID=2838878 RepID=UPI001BE8E0B2|nr:MBL fold metallo-hydrolase [Rhodoferax sp. U11-2br]MBT3069154.1 MBL fold metallo-hydrolase [Rhodoferax sp. U11-2br]
MKTIPVIHTWAGKSLAALLLGVLSLTAAASLLLPADPDYSASAQFYDGRFHNPVPRPPQSFIQHMKLYYEFFFKKPPGTVPDRPIPVRTITQAELLDAPDNSVYRLGHSSLLLKMHNKFWLTDPVFSERASPMQWFGPARFHAPPITLEELPPIEAVILSHNHYDHLDHDAVLKLAAKTKVFLAPLGVGRLLLSWGIAAQQVRELDWWDETEVDGIRFVATPAQHFSGRGFSDSDRTLWASWVMLDAQFRLFFSGDSGYFPGFKTIGERYGPFDMSFIETGAYDHKWAYVHMQPEESLQAFRDLRGKWLFPIHNGTFDLAMHVWDDPFERITSLAAEHQVAITTPMMGERASLLAPHPGSAWWRSAAPTPAVSTPVSTTQPGG